jgi:hypothetical protein
VHSRWLTFGGIAAIVVGVSVGLTAIIALAHTGSCGSGYQPCPPGTGVKIIFFVFGILAFVFGILAFVFGLVLRNHRGPMIGSRAVAMLISSGRPAFVTVRQFTPTRLQSGSNYWASMLLTVEPQDETTPYDTWVTTPVPSWAAPRPGERYPAGIDPRDSRRVGVRFVAVASG